MTGVGGGVELSGEHLSSMCKALSSVTSTIDKRNKQKNVRPDVVVYVSYASIWGLSQHTQTTTKAVRP